MPRFSLSPGPNASGRISLVSPPDRPPNKHQKKTEETRSKLLRSAQKVFAKVGFEAARLEDIAKDAGYTRGAFYAHFTSKEDLFFALLEQQIYRHLTRIQAIMDASADEAAALGELREYYVAATTDRNWCMLMLEFKLFAIRHPKMRANLAEKHRQIRTLFESERLNVLRKANLASHAPSRPWATRVALEAMLHGLTLESAYDPVALSQDEAGYLLGKIFDLLTSVK
jgi:AcrR family transcriptional regulator